MFDETLLKRLLGSNYNRFLTPAVLYLRNADMSNAAVTKAMADKFEQFKNKSQPGLINLFLAEVFNFK